MPPPTTALPLASARPEPGANRALRRPMHPSRPGGDRQRAILLALVSGNPGIHVLRASCILGINWNSCLYHARRLERDGCMVLRKVAGRVCLFDRRDGAASARLAPALLGEARNGRIAALALAQPGLNQKTLAGELGMAASVIHRRLLRMEELGLVDRVAHGRTVSVFATEALREAMERQQQEASLAGAALPEISEESMWSLSNEAADVSA